MPQFSPKASTTSWPGTPPSTAAAQDSEPIARASYLPAPPTRGEDALPADVLRTGDGRTYTCGDLLGEGAFGQVRLIASQEGGVVRYDALKIARPNGHRHGNKLTAAAALKADILHEVAMMRAAHSVLAPYEVMSFSVPAQPDAIAIRMPVMAGTLNELILRLDYRNCILQRSSLADTVFQQLAPALKQMHDVHGVALRDIKIDNILVSPRGELVLSDFGFATTDVLVHNCMGTPKYYAPESALYAVHRHYRPEGIQAQPYSPHKADLWQMGVLLAHLVSAASPFPLPITFDRNYMLGTLIQHHTFVRENAAAWAAWPDKRRLDVALKPGQVIGPVRWLQSSMHGAPENGVAVRAIFDLLAYDPALRTLNVPETTSQDQALNGALIRTALFLWPTRAAKAEARLAKEMKPQSSEPKATPASTTGE